MRRRIWAVLAAAALAGAPLASAAPAAAQQPLSGTISGYATSDFAYLNALNVPGVDVAKLSVAQSAAGVSNGTLTTTDQLAQPLLNLPTTGKNAYGHGAGVNLGLLQNYDAAPQAQLTIAEATSPPRSVKQTSIVDLSDTPLAPIVKAVVQPDTAAANTTGATNFCVLGKPISSGTAEVTNASLLNLAIPNMPGFSLVSVDQGVKSLSAENLVPPTTADGKPVSQTGLALSSSTEIQTAGVTIAKGSPGELTVKVLNPLRLEAVAGGSPGTASVRYAPVGEGVGPDTPVLSFTSGGQTQELTLQQLTGNGGVKLNLGVADVEIGVPPTSKVAANGTSASGSADLIRVSVPGTAPIAANVDGPLGPVLNPVLQPVVDGLRPVLGQIQDGLTSAGLNAADVRIGHFEAAAQVPAGGIECGLPVTKTVDKDPVRPGGSFTYTITVTNPYDCTLTNVKVTDTVAATDGVRWSVTGTDPTADSVSDTKVVWDDIGPIKPGGKASVTLTVRVDPASAAGRFTDTAVAVADCGAGKGTAGGGVAVPVAGRVTLGAPKVGAGVTPKGPPLAYTGSDDAAPLAAVGLSVLVLAGVALRRRLG